jgi:hypothetical protein
LLLNGAVRLTRPNIPDSPGSYGAVSLEELAAAAEKCEDGSEFFAVGAAIKAGADTRSLLSSTGALCVG